MLRSRRGESVRDGTTRMLSPVPELYGRERLARRGDATGEEHLPIDEQRRGVKGTGRWSFSGWHFSARPGSWVDEFRGYNDVACCADTASDKCIAYSMWATEADLVASETSGFYQEQVAKLKVVLAAPPLREIFELTDLT